MNSELPGTNSLISDSGGNAETVALVTLDAIELPRPAVIKIDVEGAEIKVLKGAAKLISESRPIIFCEVNCLAGYVDLIRFCRGANYRSYGSISQAFNRNNFKGEANNIFGDAAECMLVLVPMEKREQHDGILRTLTEIESEDDLALLLLRKPQYLSDVLANSPAAASWMTPAVCFDDEFEQATEIINLSSAEKEKVQQENRDLRSELSRMNAQLDQANIDRDHARRYPWKYLKVAYRLRREKRKSS